jgi:predicted nuclease of predicted toxin-antitoxin system
MLWLLDECVDAALVEWLRRSGYDVVYVADIAPRATDRDVMGLAAQDHRLRLTAAVERFGDTLFGRYTVIEDARFRARPLRSA